MCILQEIAKLSIFLYGTIEEDLKGLKVKKKYSNQKNITSIFDLTV